MFRVKYAGLLFILVFLAGCSSTVKISPETAAATTSAVSDTASSPSVAAAGDTDPGNTQTIGDNKATNDIEKAVSNAILGRDSGPDWYSECHGEGHYIMDSTRDGTTVTAYVLVMDGEYGFEDGNFVNVSGSGVIPTVITFSLDGDGNYSLVNYQMPEDGSLYMGSIKKLFPKALQDQCLHISVDRAKELTAQERVYASAYLKSIGREAAIGEFGDFAHPLLTDLGVSVEVSNMMAGSKVLGNYPFWVGNRECIEDGIRYVYQMDYSKESHKITYSKLAYDTNTVVEKYVFDSESGKELS